MKKKILCIVISLFMMIQCAPFVNAQLTDSVEPDLDMEVKHSSASAFKNGPIYLTGSDAYVDFKTTLYMSDVFGEFIYWYEKAESIIYNLADLDNTINESDLITQLKNLEITGQFEVKIWYPKTITVPSEFLDGSRLDMYGFNDGAKAIFKEISRTVDTVTDAENNIMTITIGVKDSTNPAANLKAGVLFANKEAYLADMTLTAQNVYLPAVGTYTAKGTMTGYTQTPNAITIGSRTESLRVDYEGVQAEGANKVNSASPDTMSATVNLVHIPTSSGSLVPTTDTVIFNIDGDTKEIAPIITNKGIIKFEDLPKPQKEGYTFDGWYYDSDLTDRVDEDVTFNGKLMLYGHWISDSLESEEHFAYVIGYPDGTVRPENNITREEVATIFYRLLREKALIKIATDENPFSDVAVERWSNKAISTLAKGGYVSGYEDGTFGPEKPITRAEFATMATRYAELEDSGEVTFSDISGHWAEKNIYKAATAGWVEGYEDGTFGPEKQITRAEVMTIINRMLVRYVDGEGIHEDATFWIDMTGDEWYYYNVLEATNFHDYSRREDGKLEKWLEINTNKIWVELDEMENADK